REWNVCVIGTLFLFSWVCIVFFFFFFFQAEDGIRDKLVTGVQTCALPIFAFQIHFHDDGRIALEALREYHPMRLFSGKALVATSGDAMYDLQERWIPLVAQRRNAFADESEFIVIFDGKEPECTWHRLFLDACLPSGCSVTV